MHPGSTLLDALLAQNTLPAAEVDSRSGIVVRASPALAALLDRRPADLIGSRFADHLLDRDREDFVALGNTTGAATPLTTGLVALSGATRPVRLSMHRAGEAPHPTTIVIAEPLPSIHPLVPPPLLEADDCAAPEEHAHTFRHIVLNANEGIWTIDAEQRTTFVNQRMAEMLGFSREELRGRKLTDLILPEDLPAHAAQIERRLLGHSDRYERRFVRKDGSILWTLVAGSPLCDHAGNRRGSFGLFSDITERKRTELALQLSEERYRSLLAAVTDYVFTVPYANGQPGHTTHGPGCVRVTGYEPHEYAADPHLWYRMIQPTDRPAVENHIAQTVAGTSAQTITHRLVHRDGSIRWVRNTLVPRHNTAGELIGLDGLITDTTERTIALQQLRERETLYRAVIETTADGFWTTDNAGHLLEVNDAYVLRSGYTRAELLTLSIRDLEAAESPAEVASHMARIRRDGCHLFETRHRTKDGTIWPAEINATHWPIGDGRIFVFIRDIYPRKRSEALLQIRVRMAELSQSGEIGPILQHALDTAELVSGSSVGFFHLVASDQKSHTRQTWSTNTRQRHSAPGVEMLQHPIDRSEVWEECIRQRAPVIRNDYPAQPTEHSGQECAVRVTREFTVPIIRNNCVAAVVGVGNKTSPYTDDDVEAVRQIAEVAMDFVRRLHAEESLRRNEHQLRLIIDSVPALIAHVDPEYRLQLVNEAFHHWFGDPLPVIIPRTVSEQFGDAAWHELKPSFDHAFAGETSSFELEVSLRRAGRRWLHGTCTPDRDEAGTVRGVVILANDITAAKELETQLLRAQRLEVVGRLASGVAHDLNNILQPVLMAPRLLRPAITDPEALGLIDTIEGSVRRGADIIKQLLAFGRGTEARRVPLRLDSLVADLGRILRETLPKNIVLRCELPAHSQPVMADATQVHQVLMNLCVNARDAMRTGGTLIVRLEHIEFAVPPRNAVPHGREGSFQLLSVIDQGSGIDAQHMPKLFDPFFTTKDVGEGTGLGLPTVLGIVRSHDGFIQVESARGFGSTFRVYFPEIEHAGLPAVASTKPAQQNVAGQHRHILVVDDEEDIRDMIRRTLLRQGFRVSEAANEAEALVMLAQRENAIDLVIADLLMPVMDGASLIKELHHRRPSLPIMAISGHTGPRHLPPESNGSIPTLLAKPFDADQLLGAIVPLLRLLP